MRKLKPVTGMNKKLQAVCRKLERFVGVEVVGWNLNPSMEWVIHLTAPIPFKDYAVEMRLTIVTEGAVRKCGVLVPALGSVPADTNVDSFTVKLNRERFAGKFLPYSQQQVCYRVEHYFFADNPPTELLERLIMEAMVASELFVHLVKKLQSPNNAHEELGSMPRNPRSLSLN